ncbi:MAG: hypothetical protein ACK500_08875 [Flavobacteriales bacterium]
MKYAVLAVIMTLSAGLSAQEWVDYQVDSVFTISLPDNYELAEVKGQHVITAQLDYGVIVITVLDNSGGFELPINSEKDLLKAYEDMSSGFSNGVKGEIISYEVIEMSGLKLAKMMISGLVYGEQQIADCLMLVANGKLYGISLWVMPWEFELIASVRDRFFSSMRLAPSLTFESQMYTPSEDSRAYALGQKVGLLLFCAVIVVLTLFFIFRMKEKKKREGADLPKA